MNKWVSFLAAGLVSASLAFGGSVMAQAPEDRPVNTRAGYVDENGDGVCDFWRAGERGATGWRGYGQGMGPTEGRANFGWRGSFAGSIVEAISEATGLTRAEVWAALEDGKTVEGLLSEYSVTDDQVVSAVLEERQALLDEAVAEGRLSEEQRDLMLEHMEANITEAIEEGLTNCQPNLGQQNQRGTASPDNQSQGAPMGKARARGSAR